MTAQWVGDVQQRCRPRGLRLFREQCRMTAPVTAPKRIQLSRRKGYRKSEGAIVVSRPSKWGNPYKVEEHGRVQSVMLYSFDLAHHVLGIAIYERIRAELGGHDLACWCPLEDADGNRVPCHADQLLELANRVDL